MTKEEIESEAKQIAANYGYEKSQSLANSIVALCGRVREDQRDADEAAVAWHMGCGGHDHGHPGSDCLGSAANSIRAGGSQKPTVRSNSLEWTCDPRAAALDLVNDDD